MKSFLPLAIITITFIMFQSGCDTVEPVTGTVKGKLINHNNIPAPNFEIKIGDQKTTTGLQGEFTFNDVTMPYELAVINREDSRAEIYRGMTTHDPVVVTNNYVESNYTTIEIKFPRSSIHSDLYIQAAYSNGSNTNFSKTYYPPIKDTVMQIYCNIPDQQTGRIYLLSYRQDFEGNVISYDNFGVSPPIQVNPGSYHKHVFSQEDISYNPQESVAEGRFIYPFETNGYSYLMISFSPNKSLHYENIYQSIRNDNFSVKVPVGLPVPVYYNVYKEYYFMGYSAEVFEINPGAENLINVKNGVESIFPYNNAKDITMNSVLNYDVTIGKGIYKIVLNNESLPGRYIVYTTSEFLALKDLEPYLFGSINNNSFYWYVEYSGETENVDTYGKDYYQNDLEYQLLSFGSTFRTKTNF